MKRLNIQDPELERQAQGADEIVIGGRVFVAVAVEDGREEDALTPEEMAMVEEALSKPGRALTDQEATEYLRRREKELGLD